MLYSSGPWSSVGKYKADLVGPEEMELPRELIELKDEWMDGWIDGHVNWYLIIALFITLAEGQDFKGFYATSQVGGTLIFR